MDIQHCMHKFDHKAEYTEHDVESFFMDELQKHICYLLLRITRTDATIGHLSQDMGSKGV